MNVSNHVTKMITVITYIMVVAVKCTDYQIFSRYYILNALFGSQEHQMNKTDITHGTMEPISTKYQYSKYTTNKQIICLCL